ncbi:MAG: DEAD/DEAH box helicase [Deltaproteobacteria bacterium]|jgi:DNA repair protein RadD|nr:DEAD/DEAH box helicase [Deltaproteobacteria bacterium]
MLELRPYQSEALAEIKAVLKARKRFLLQAATGAGKTHILAHLIKDWMGRYSRMRAVMLAHRQELVEQAYRKFYEVWPEGLRNMGKACAGLGKVSTSARVIIGTPQTLVRRNIFDAVHLVIVDEAHHLQNKAKDSQYHEVIRSLRNKYPDLMLLGVTATPYRFNQGPIYGGPHDWFPELNHEISMTELIELGYLAPIRIKVNTADGLASDLSKIGRSHGDYKISPLSAAMCKEVYIESAVQAWQEYGEGRRRVCVFAVSIEHAELLTDALTAAGLKAKAVHSKMEKKERESSLLEFAKGEIDFIVSVGILTEGWDCPEINLILMARPTLSPGLYVQMVGRGTRTAEGKANLLILDLVGNYLVHGDPKDPRIRPAKGVRTCPACREVVPDPQARVCPACGYEWPEPQARGEDKPLADSGLDKLVEVRKDMGTARILDFRGYRHTSRAGNVMLRLDLTIQEEGARRPSRLSHYLDIEGLGSDYGYRKARKWWRRHSERDVIPDTVNEALSLMDDLVLPEQISLVLDNKFLKADGW